MSSTRVEGSSGHQQEDYEMASADHPAFLDVGAPAARDALPSPRSADSSSAPPQRWDAYPPDSAHGTGSLSPSAAAYGNGNGQGAGTGNYFGSSYGTLQLPMPPDMLAPPAPPSPNDAQRAPSSGPDRRRHRSSPVAYASTSAYHARHGSEGADSSATFSSNSSGSHPRPYSDGTGTSQPYPNGSAGPDSRRFALPPILGEPGPVPTHNLPPIYDRPSDKGAASWRAAPQPPHGYSDLAPPPSHPQQPPPTPPLPPQSALNDASGAPKSRPRHARAQSDTTDAGHIPRMKTKTKLTTMDRKKICIYAADHPSKRQEDIALHFHIERSTVSKILKNRKEWLARPDEESDRAKNRPIKYPFIEQHLEDYLDGLRTKQILITDNIIRERALEIARELNYPDLRDFKASAGWVEAFKSRAGIRLGCFPGVDALRETRRNLPPPPSSNNQGFVRPPDHFPDQDPFSKRFEDLRVYAQYGPSGKPRSPPNPTSASNHASTSTSYAYEPPPHQTSRRQPAMRDLYVREADQAWRVSQGLRDSDRPPSPSMQAARRPPSSRELSPDRDYGVERDHDAERDYRSGREYGRDYDDRRQYVPRHLDVGRGYTHRLGSFPYNREVVYDRPRSESSSESPPNGEQTTPHQPKKPELPLMVIDAEFQARSVRGLPVMPRHVDAYIKDIIFFCRARKDEGDPVCSVVELDMLELLAQRFWKLASGVELSDRDLRLGY